MEEEEEPEYEIEKIISERVKDGIKEYRVKWIGYSESGIF